MSVNADFVGTEDRYECSDNNGRYDDQQYCDPNPLHATCIENEGASPSCECRAENGYHGNGQDCRLKPDHYDALVKDQYFRLEHRDRLDYGWRISEINMYSDPECTAQVFYSSGTCATEPLDQDTLRYPALAGGATLPGMVVMEMAGTDPMDEFGGGSALAECSVRVRGSYPGEGQGPASLFDLNVETPWWSECLNCNPEPVDATRAGPAFVEWYVRARERIMCFELIQMEGHHTSSYVLEAGPITGQDCGYDQPQHCAPTQVWSFPENSFEDPVVEVVAAGNTVRTRIRTMCGIQDTQIFGEILSAPIGGTTGDGSEHFGSYAQNGLHANDSPLDLTVTSFLKTVPSPCHCQQLCIDHIADGCRSYKYLDVSDGQQIRHCYLQVTPFTADGIGVWGSKVGTGVGDWPGWTSGTPGLRLSEFSTTPAGEIRGSNVMVPPGVAFALTINGVSLPFSEVASRDQSQRQRIKVVYEADSCDRPIPPEVKGIGCSTTVRNTPVGKDGVTLGTRQDAVYTHCSPRPNSRSTEHATFQGLRIAATNTEQLYKVCYCSGRRCYDPKSWMEVANRLIVAPSTYTWLTDPASPILRKTVANTLSLTVQRPAFKAYTDPSQWRIRVVRHYFDCDIYHYSSGFQCGGPEVQECAPTAQATADSATWQFSLNLQHSVENSDVGLYRICFRESDSATTPWQSIPSGMADRSMTLEVVKIEQDKTNPRGIFHNQFLSALEGDTTQVTLQGTRLITPSASKIVLNAHPSRICGDNSLFSFRPGDSEMVVDATPPILLPQSSEPQHAGEVGQKLTIMLAFNENIQKGSGNLLLVPEQGDNTNFPTIVMNVRNPFVTFSANKVIVTPKRATGARGSLTALAEIPGDPLVISHWDSQVVDDLAQTRYTLQTSQAGVVLDTATNPNQISQIDTADSWKFTVTGQAKPVVLRTQPAHDDEGIDPASAVIAIQFSEYVTYNNDGTNRLVRITDCGRDQDCSTQEDNLVNSVDIQDFIYGTEADATQQCNVEVFAGGGQQTLTFSFEQGLAPALLKYEETLNTPSVDVLVPQTNIVFGCQQTLTNYAANPFSTFCFDAADREVPCGSADAVRTASYTGVDYGYIYYIASGLLQPDMRYVVTVPAGAVSSGADTNDEFQFEFYTGVYDRFKYAYAFSPNSEASGPDGLVYDVQLGANLIEYNDVEAITGVVPATGTGPLKVFKYTICFCDEQVDAETSDGTVEGSGRVFDMRDGQTTYALTDNSKCEPTAGQVYIGRDRMLTGTQAHVCSVKCDKGCTGPTCFCDGNRDAQLQAVADPNHQRLCLSPAMCRAACDAHATTNQIFASETENSVSLGTFPPFTCIGIDVQQNSNACYLIGDATNTDTTGDNCLTGQITTNEEYMHLRKLEGTACTHPSDFNEYAGILSVTRRVRMGVDYVLDPGMDAAGSIEVSYANTPTLTADGLAGISRDRITIIDCRGTCGVSSPSAGVTTPENATDIETWNSFWPVNYFVDRPHIDSKNPSATEGVTDAAPALRTYAVRESKFCEGRNVDPETTFLHMDGALQALQQHQCYTKCSKNAPYTGEDDACNGHFSGYDGPDSNALCLTTEQLGAVCDQIQDCTSFDKHKHLNRGFLNVLGEDGSTCMSNDANLKDSEDYDWHRAETETETGDLNTRQRRLQQLTELSFAFSWNQLLRWRSVSFATGGTFKLCFCDSEHLTIQAQQYNSACRSVRDYAIEIGTIHVSGVSCLLSDPRFQRVACKSQYYGGLRCYKSSPPVLDPSSEMEDASSEVAEDLLNNEQTVLVLSTWCTFGPEEQVRNDPRCQLVAAFQSTSGGLAGDLTGAR